VHLEDKKNFVDSKEQLQVILEKSNNDNYYYAIQEKLIDYANIPDGELNKDQVKEKNDLHRIWDLKQVIKDAVNSKDSTEEDVERLEKEQEKLKKKYFAKEIEADANAYEYRLQLNRELKKFIKRIVLYPYGFPADKPSKPFIDREGESTSKKHTEEALTYIHNLKSETFLKYKPKNKNTGWTEAEISRYLDIPRTTLRNYYKKKLLPDVRGTNDSLKKLWKAYMEYGKKSIKSSSENLNREELTKFYAYKIEFTDMCKPDMEKYVLPYYKDVTQGISFNLNTKNGAWDFEGGFGGKEIKMLRPNTDYAKKKLEGKRIFYVEDDPVFHKGLHFMLSATNQKWEEILENINSVFNKENFLKCETPEQMNDFFNNALSQILIDLKSLQQNIKLIGGGSPGMKDKIVSIQNLAKSLLEKKKSGVPAEEIAKEFFGV
jgi:hypothetical protein